MPPEEAVYLKDILKILGWSQGKYYYKKQELLDAGVVMYRYEGRPPHKRVIAFPSRIQNWMAYKSSRGEML